jgi:hypothetical protein
MPSPACKSAGARALRRIGFAFDRFKASARAGAYFAGVRRAARFAVRPVDQDGVLLLMPREPSFGFFYVPLVVLSAAAGAALAAFA